MTKADRVPILNLQWQLLPGPHGVDYQIYSGLSGPSRFTRFLKVSSGKDSKGNSRLGIEFEPSQIWTISNVNGNKQ